MHRYLDFHAFGLRGEVAIHSLIQFSVLGMWLAVVGRSFGRRLGAARVVILVLAPALAALAGGKLLSELAGTPEGNSYYGALALQAACFAALVRTLAPMPLRRALWGEFTWLSALSYGLLRIGCFFDGCCWGRLCSAPWAVRYVEYRSLMPWLGIPVHPVQIYAAMHGLLLAAVFWRYRRARFAGYAGFAAFGALMGLGRLITDPFRADWTHGAQLAGMPFNGALSVIIIALGFVFLVRRRLAPIALALCLTGCLQPSPPDARTLTRSALVESGALELNEMAETPAAIKGSKPNSLARAPIDHRPNLLLVVIDDILQDQTRPLIQGIYPGAHPAPGFEDVVWWYYSPLLQPSYGNVVRIPRDRFNAETFRAALLYMEKQDEPYDVFLLVHGMPNHILSSKDQGFIDWTSIDAMKGKLTHARMLYLQSCFGGSLAPDFRAAGFRRVVAYDGLTDNFFFAEYLIRALALEGADDERALTRVMRDFPDDLSEDLIARHVVEGLFHESVESYLKRVAMPGSF